MVGPVPAREEESARLSGARGDFVGSLGRRVEALRAALRALEQSPSDGAQQNGLLRRVHALASAARVLGFASVAEALTEAERKLRGNEFREVARALDLLPSLVLGVPISLRAPTEARGSGGTGGWPVSALVFGAQALADAVRGITSAHVECERTEDLTHAREQARSLGPDLAIIDADRPGARELVESFVKDPALGPVLVVVVGDFASPEAASAFIALGASRVLSKPVSSENLQHTVVELRALAAEPRVEREPLGELSVEALTERISTEIRRGLLESVEPSARGASVGFGDGADVMAAVWGAVARVRELVTLRSSGAVRFDSSGPEGAVPFAAWGNEERRAGERGMGAADQRTGDGVSLQGRRVVVADDDPGVVWFMSGLLKTMGVEVLEAHDGARALALTYDAWPDLVISDVLMPKLDGFSLCHEIKRDVAVRDVPVILLSWKEDLLQRVRELGAAADGYLRKEAAAATVAERLREVLRPRARVEQRLAAGVDARGRLDGFTPRLILELASAGERDARVGIRDAAYLYEVQVRRGRLCSATRTAAKGEFDRGEAVLAALLGVSAGRFVIEADRTPVRGDFEGLPATILKAPIERARSALHSTSAGALLGVTRVEISNSVIEGYLSCTPDPARSLLQQVMAGASPRELIMSGAVAPRLLEAVLSDAARRGAISRIERVGSEPAPARESKPPEPEMLAATIANLADETSDQSSVARPEAEISDEESGWFSLQIESAAPVPVGSLVQEPPHEREPPVARAEDVRVIDAAPPPSGFASGAAPRVAATQAMPIRVAEPADDDPVSLPFSSAVTPSFERIWDAGSASAGEASSTLQGVGTVPSVMLASASNVESVFHPTGGGPDSALNLEPDGLAGALTEESPPPSSTREVGATKVMGTVALPLQAAAAADVSPIARSDSDATPSGPPSPPPIASPAEPAVARTRVSPLKPEPSRSPAEVARSPEVRIATGAPAGSSSVPRWLMPMLLAFAVCYSLVSYFRADVIGLFSGQSPASPPALPR